VLVLALVIVGGTILAIPFFRSSTARISDRPEVASLASALGARRPTQARLTGGFRYAPWTGTERGAEATTGVTSWRVLPVAVLGAVRAAEDAAASSDVPRTHAAWGTAMLIAGDVDKAVSLLESAAARAKEDAQIHSELAAAYLTRAERFDQPDYWMKGLAAAERARRLREDLPEALFNRALAMENVGLLDPARAAWKDYLAVDGRSPWADEARRHAADLDAVLSRPGEWDAFRQQLATLTSADTASAGTTSADLSRDVGRATPFRQDLRQWLEGDLIPAWAQAVVAGDAAAAELRLRHARAVADLLSRAGGDDMPRLGLARAAALANDKTLGVALARAHQVLPEVLRLFDDGQVEPAANQFAGIEPAFRAAGSPYAYWGAVYTGVIQSNRRLADDMRRTLDRDSDLDAREDLRYLRGRRRWLRGLLALNLGDLETARGLYDAALADFEATGERDSTIAIHALRAENMSALGARREAWRYERLALEQVWTVTVPRRQHLVLQLGGALCLADGLPEAALVFQAAVIRTGERANQRPVSLVEGHLFRARAYLPLGDRASALEDLTRASAFLPRIPDEKMRRRQEAELDATAAEVKRDAAPVDAVQAASRALAFFGDPAGAFRRPRLLVLRGRAHLASGEPVEAERDFAAAIAEFDAQRDRVLARPLRISLFDAGRAAFEQMVTLQLTVRGNARAAMDYAERARARTLFEAMAGSASAKPLSIDALQPRLPDDLAVLFYSVLDDRTFVWILSRDGRLRAFERPITRVALAEQVEAVRWMLTAPASSANADADTRLAAALRRAFVDLIAPAAPELSRVRRLVVVPDGPLHALPFASLIDPATDRPLIERFVLSTAPSLNALVRTFGSSTPPADPRVLVVGDPALDPRATSLPRLPFAAAEARDIAQTYGAGVESLADRSATASAFLQGLAGADIVHYAGHAVADAWDPDNSHLLLAPDAAHDGLLRVGDLRRATLRRHPIVVLAACSTNSGRIAVGEGVLGLARPFLEAGAGSVVATLWDIQDRSSAAFFLRVHERLAAGERPAQALAETQREYLHATDFAKRRPSQWAWAVSIGGL